MCVVSMELSVNLFLHQLQEYSFLQVTCEMGALHEALPTVAAGEGFLP